MYQERDAKGGCEIRPSTRWETEVQVNLTIN